jgi:ABC-type sugar transport system ATPase subunit
MGGDAMLRMSGIQKRFGASIALDGVDLEIRRGELHALVGENGAGKSTLMKILSGALGPDAGAMTLDGAPYAPRDPAEGLRRGVAMIYQELTLAPDLSVAQNLLLGRELHRGGVIDRAAERVRVLEILALLEHRDLDPDRRVDALGPGPRQLVEIGRALIGEARVVVLDEPTSSLSTAEARALDAVLGKLRARGVSIVYITHFLEELERLADRFTVLRDGRTVGTGDVAGTPAPRIVELMVGRSIDETYPRVEHAAGDPILALDRPIADNVTLSREVARFGVLSRNRSARVAARLAELGIKTRGPGQPASELSGGNQQKVALARLFHQEADVLLLDEPTRGVDVGSKVEIYRRIGELAAKGKAVLVASSYLPELLGICDRIAVMHRGVLGEARPASAWTQPALLEEATRGAA